MPITQREAIKKILNKYTLTSKIASKLLGVSVDTMRAYLTDPSSKRYRVMKESRLKFLKEQAQKRVNALKSIHGQFNNVLERLETFVASEYGLQKKDLHMIYSTDKKYTAAKKLYQLIDAVNDIWVDYIYCDLDSLRVLRE